MLFISNKYSLWQPKLVQTSYWVIIKHNGGKQYSIL